MTRRIPGGDEAFDDALRVARMYYLLGLTTTEIAKQIGLPRPTVSRLLSWAKESGLVEFRINDHRERQLSIETKLEDMFHLADVKVVPCPPDQRVEERQRSVAAFTAHYLNGLVKAGSTISLAWGATISLLAKSLIPKPLPGVTIVQLNGSGNSGLGTEFAAEIISTFAQNYTAAAHLLPIPAYFDDPNTKEAMFRERSIRRIRTIAETAQILLFSIGVPDADSYVYRAGYVENREFIALRNQGVVGDIGTVFFRVDGSYKDIEMNLRSSGPELATLADHQHAICLVAGEKKLPGLLGALRGGFLNTLIIDQPTAELLVKNS
ncbi:MAG: helix-turn-helix domain-containing protein [Trueperaceae bacterium]|nr:helix-turn-helix domain-containing protein [Trueperaceae bacterium]MCO5175231.1 helix-turn-helix domain-containing protein [Trueperaceae bacterium]